VAAQVLSVDHVYGDRPTDGSVSDLETGGGGGGGGSRGGSRGRGCSENKHSADVKPLNLLSSARVHEH